MAERLIVGNQNALQGYSSYQGCLTIFRAQLRNFVSKANVWTKQNFERKLARASERDLTTLQMPGITDILLCLVAQFRL